MNSFTQTIKIFSNNINGLNLPTKRKKLLNYLGKSNYNIIALQETHVAQKHAKYLINTNLGRVFYSSDIKKKRGVAIYMDERLNHVEEFRDQEGRIIAVKIGTDLEKILVCNIYVPNGPKRKFVKLLRQKIDQAEFDHIIILGDFNGVLDINLDKSIKQRRKINNTLPKNIIQLKEEYDLQDIWRLRNPNQKDFTFYSNRHKSWSRLDMIWVSKSLVTKIDEIKILARDLSDHSPLIMNINKKKKFTNWKLDSNLIKKEIDIKKIKLMTKEYFQWNDNQETSPQIIWDAYKAVARGFLIQQKALKNKLKNQKLFDLQKEINITENQFKKRPGDVKILKNLEILHKQKKNLELEKLANQPKWIRQNTFENANKPGKWLARIIRKKKNKQQIRKIETKGKEVYTDEGIKEEFERFYRDLYKKDQIDPEQIGEYLSNQKLQKITEDQRLILNKEITEEEIKVAIKSLDANKSPGPDGFTACFYKIDQEETIKYFKTIMNEALNKEIIPDSWKKAEIVLIHKEGLDPNNVRNYRPISLLNTDYKIFTKILANGFTKFLTEWISEDQTGFLPSQSTKDNVRIIIDSIEYFDINHQKEVGFLGLDAEKAFDNVNWEFFKLLLKELDIGIQFQNGINAIYSQQNARIRINNQFTEEFGIAKGTRHGCPLSPLIFIFTLEILIRSIKTDENLRGIKLDKQEIKIRAFANDVICIIENPKIKIKNWIN
uniref:Reverse transcriptase domain-containing protein n=1 Tax=Anolis carolinensis TaxID=28377 RepID=G1KVC2_ANOCA